MNLPLVSGFEHSTYENCGTSQALCTPMMKIADSLTLCAPPRPSRQLRNASRSVHPPDDNCRQSQALRASPHENSGTFQALCTGPPCWSSFGSSRFFGVPLFVCFLKNKRKVRFFETICLWSRCRHDSCKERDIVYERGARSVRVSARLMCVCVGP